MPAQAIAPRAVPLPKPRNPRRRRLSDHEGGDPGKGHFTLRGGWCPPRNRITEHRMDRVPSDLVIVANRLPVDRVALPDGTREWRGSPGGLVTAIEPVMRANNGVWIGWPG